MDVSRKTCMFFDPSGDYVHLAEAVVPEFHQVKFFSIWEKAFSISKDFLPGIGLDGIERVKDFFDELDSTDLVVCPDVGNYGLQEWLRKQGMPVCGSGKAGVLEQDRALLKRECMKMGIDVAHGTIVKGIDALRKILSTDDELYVKLSYFRGDMETFGHKNALSSRAWLDDLALKMGPYGQIAEFLVETPIGGDDDDCVEIGIDTFCADGEVPDTIAFGYEAKDAAYIGTTSILPSRMRVVLEKLRPILQFYGYRGPFSSETREVDDESYMIDFTARFGSPPSEAQSKNIENLGEVMDGVANGMIVEPEYRFPIMAQIVMRSEWFAEHPMAMQIDRPDRVAVHGHCRINGQDYAASPSEIAECCGAIGLGNTLEDAIAEATEVAEGVKGHGLTFDSGALRKVMESIRTGNKLGLTWGRLTQGSNGYGEERRA